jgi:hypothetical protein
MRQRAPAGQDPTIQAPAASTLSNACPGPGATGLPSTTHAAGGSSDVRAAVAGSSGGWAAHAARETRGSRVKRRIIQVYRNTSAGVKARDS